MSNLIAKGIFLCTVHSSLFCSTFTNSVKEMQKSLPVFCLLVGTLLEMGTGTGARVYVGARKCHGSIHHIRSETEGPI